MLVSYFFGYFKMLFVVMQGFFEITKSLMSIAKVIINTSLPMLVSYFYSYFKT